MRFYTQQHQYYCGIDLHARSMYLCIMDQNAHRTTGPPPHVVSLRPLDFGGLIGVSPLPRAQTFAVTPPAPSSTSSL